MKARLRLKVFRMNVIPVCVAVVLFMVLGIYQVRRFAGIMEQTSLDQNAVIMDTMTDSMREMATENYQKFVLSEAKILDGEFWTIRHDLEVLASQVQKVLEHPELYAGEDVISQLTDGTFSAPPLIKDVILEVFCQGDNLVSEPSGQLSADTSEQSETTDIPENSIKPGADTANTGDTSSVLVIFAVLAVSLASVLVLIKGRKKMSLDDLS